MLTRTRSMPIESSVPAVIRAPRLGDGASMWRIAVDSQVLDVNSSYAYLLWCRDFRATSVVVEIGGEVAGFTTGYLRPQAPDVLFVWQVAVDHAYRGRGLGVAMLDHLVDNVAAQGISTLETTVSPDNEASLAMFAALARRWGARMTREPLFEPQDFPDGHESEDLYRIGPLQPAAQTSGKDHR
ncbi:diaminobutyrate acetyltransferase [Nocardia sp. CDC159]|uniref:L-2,4-diaminobutyric acid acetyltransferase n=1 Tax=Nocardia pulmonis TaxID=2951408 RepID=A0A9X2E986_9NOCA|nr:MULTISPECIES: diaminobutyrate acetyltransferase [Nocardia]MCM6773848.1 diaminobutyrate acetyltransferase [Nocardia pulmonis]MCM6786735.1 diaminobutyrate acetyltransferase [Nocardia sp. CDC159]